MEELGPEGKRLHRETGERLKLGSGDRVLLIGEKGAWMRDGILAAGAREEMVETFDRAEDARAEVATFAGAVLLKGSRAIALETIVPTWVAGEETAGDEGC